MNPLANLTTWTTSDIGDLAVSNMKIGSIANKNLNIRNITLMRNIGKYPLYDIPMFPEIGMVYNVYERLLNRPVRHYSEGNNSWKKTKSGLAVDPGKYDEQINETTAINGLIEYTNEVTQDLGSPVKEDPWKDLWAKIRNKEKQEVDDSYTNGHFRKIETGENRTPKTVYVSNSGSLGMMGGTSTLQNVRRSIDEYLKWKNDEPYVTGAEIAKSIESNLDFTGRQKVDSATSNRFLGKEEVYKNYRNPNSIVLDDNRTIYYETAEGDDKAESVIGINHSNYNVQGIEDKTNDLFSKTNKLFNERKIKSIIDRYQTEEGWSRGRALLVAGDMADGRGYHNPFCRVWTVTKQYDKMNDLIRPFFKYDNGDSDRVKGDDKGSSGKFYTIKEIQDGMFDSCEGMRPNDGASRLDSMSVLQSNGFVNIGSFHKDNVLDTESIKRCMFSIENLAWRDVRPEALVKTKGKDGNGVFNGYVLTPEQRGPNNGRIMWFPPYNLKFTENTSARWNNNTFIGRGEDVYTYTNTERGGTLSFTLLIDHPSVIDTWKGEEKSKEVTVLGKDGKELKQTWWNNKDENEQRILRFFAGCDEFLGGDCGSCEPDDPKKPNGDNGCGGKDPNKPLGKDNNGNNNDNLCDNKPDKTPKEGELPAVVVVPVFFPNNYSGRDDIDGDKTDAFVDYIRYGITKKLSTSEISEAQSNLIDKMHNFVDINIRYSVNEFISNCMLYCTALKDREEKTPDPGHTKEEWMEILKETRQTIENLESYVNTNIPKDFDKFNDNKSINPVVDRAHKFINIVNGIIESHEEYKNVWVNFQIAAVNYVGMPANYVEGYFNETLDKKHLQGFIESSKNGGSDKGYEMGEGKGGTTLNDPIECTATTKNGRILLPNGKPYYWHYKVDKVCTGEIFWYVYENGKYYYKDNVYKELKNGFYKNNWDTDDLGLNNFNEVNTAFTEFYKAKLAEFNINEEQLKHGNIVFSFEDVRKATTESRESLSGNALKFKNIIDSSGKDLKEIWCLGDASLQGHEESNDKNLAPFRAESIAKWLRQSLKKMGVNQEIGGDAKGFEDGIAQADIKQQKKNTKKIANAEQISIWDVSSETHKVRRCAFAILNFSTDSLATEFGKALTSTGKQEDPQTTDISGTQQKEESKETEKVVPKIMVNQTVVNEGWCKTYDNEYRYFQHLKETESFIHNRILEKVKYFDPAYHSITPEGFNARLTFLHQCTRQGPSFREDLPGNMVFGRAPYCVLRIGDFYNTKIVIDSVSINYGDNQWDMNPEGVGVQPIMANVDINFKFIGGSDISGPIDRLQNAASFNFYSNTSIYDRRADYRNGFVERDVSTNKETVKNPVNYWDVQDNMREK